jgi:hypothetical protein
LVKGGLGWAIGRVDSFEEKSAIRRYHGEVDRSCWSYHMPSPFPKMDSYLEHPSRWSEVYSRFISAIANGLEKLMSYQR